MTRPRAPNLAWSALLLGLLLLPGLALADARVEARKRFKAGMALIKEGSYEDGIEQLLEAYSVKPHPSVLYNVAVAYESLDKPHDALQYYRRYLESNPPDVAAVKQAIARLEARLAAERPKEPEPKPVPVAAAKPAVDEAQLARLAALTDRLEAALQKAESQNAERQPQGEAPQKPAASVDADPEALEAEFTEVPYEETVVTASRRAQSSLEAPNAMTVITAEEIRMSGLRSLPELLRRVPGAEVMMMGAASANVSIRGFNQRVANKVLVLIDGRPEYQDFLGITIWPAFPIGLEEIERIEIIRGPGSALYGANAMLGVINIITRAPGSGAPMQFDAFGGNGDTAGGGMIASGGSRVKYRASAGYQQTDKWSRDYADDRSDIAPQVTDTSLGLRSGRANLVAHYTFNKDVSVTAAGGVSQLFTEFYALGLLRNFFIDGTNGYAKANANLGPMRLQFFWNTLSANAGPQYWPIGERSLATTLQSNVFDFEALFQKDFTLLGQHRFAVGISGRVKRLSWTYIGALQQEVHAAAFLTEEWRIIKQLTLNLGYRIDRHPLLDNGSPGYAQSPRVSVVFSPAEGHALRASFATAFRVPTFLESYMDIRTPIAGVNGASVLTEGSRTLKPERLLSFELGYRGEAARYGLDWELALYQNYVNDLIVLSAVQRLPPEQAYDPQSQSYLLGRSTFQNDPVGYIARGAEVGFTWSATAGLDLRLSTALQSITTSTSSAAVCGPCTQAPAFKVFGGVSYRSPVGLDLTLDGALTTSTVWVEREPAPEDPTTISNTQYALPTYGVINARVGYRFLDDRLSVAVVGTQLGPLHQEHPFGNQSARRVLATITVKP